MTQVQIFDDTPCDLGEGPLWHPARGMFFWFDITGHALYAREDNRRLSWQFEDAVSAAGWVDHDNMLIATATGLINYDLSTGAQQRIAPLEADRPDTRSNDGRADPFGGFWIGTMGRQAEPDAGAIYRYYRGEMRQLFAPVTIPNAICFSPGGEVAYFADTAKSTVWRQALDGEGWPLGGPEVFLDLSGQAGLPDGAVVDTNGGVWIARWGGAEVTRFRADGSHAMSVSLPVPHVTCPAFGGPDGHDLLITTARQGMSSEALAKAPDAGSTFILETQYQGQGEFQVRL